MKKFFFLIILIITCEVQAQEQGKIIMSNPLNLSYRFQTDGVCRREAADPVIILFKDQYYLFALFQSKRLGLYRNQNSKSRRGMGTRCFRVQRCNILFGNGRKPNLQKYQSRNR